MLWTRSQKAWAPAEWFLTAPHASRPQWYCIDSLNSNANPILETLALLATHVCRSKSIHEKQRKLKCRYLTVLLCLFRYCHCYPAHFSLTNHLIQSSLPQISKCKEKRPSYLKLCKSWDEAGGASRNREDAEKAALVHDLSIIKSLSEETCTNTESTLKKGKIPPSMIPKRGNNDRFQILWEIPVLLGKSYSNWHVSELEKPSLRESDREVLYGKSPGVVEPSPPLHI